MLATTKGLANEAKLLSFVEQIAKMSVPLSFREEGTANLDDETLCDAACTLYALIDEARKLTRGKE